MNLGTNFRWKYISSLNMHLVSVLLMKKTEFDSCSYDIFGASRAFLSSYRRVMLWAHRFDNHEDAPVSSRKRVSDLILMACAVVCVDGYIIPFPNSVETSYR